MEGFWLRKGEVYKIKTDSTIFSRDYMLFSPSRDYYYSGNWCNYIDSIFTINLNGEFKCPSNLGIWTHDYIAPLEVKDWLEIGQYLKNTPYRVNLRLKKIIDTSLEGDLEEI